MSRLGAFLSVLAESFSDWVSRANSDGLETRQARIAREYDIDRTEPRPVLRLGKLRTIADHGRAISHPPTLTGAERERLLREAEEADTLPPGRYALRPPPNRSN